MMDLQAAIGIHQFDHIEIWLERRNEIWQRYAEELEDLPVVLPAPDDPRTRHARHLYTLMIDPETSGITRDEFMNRMHAKNIGTGVHYIGVHLHPWYRENLGTNAEDFPNATWISERTVSIPLTPHLQDEDVTDVITAIRESLNA